jgi:hypothetical protein
MTAHRTLTARTKRGAMKTVLAAILAAAVMLPAVAAAQIKTLPTEEMTVTATVVALDYKTRVMTVKEANGILNTMTVPPEVKRFDALKVGDTITAKYHETIILRLMKPGEAAVDSLAGSLTPGAGVRPNLTATAQRSITATVTAIDPAIPSITLTGPDKKTYTHTVTDREALKQVKVGDRLDITWSAAVLISVEGAKPK